MSSDPQHWLQQHALPKDVAAKITKVFQVPYSTYLDKKKYFKI
jgi:hypothetical protein